VVEATVTNTGAVAGDEVAELYLKFPSLAGAPRLALRGFQRVHLEPGASTKVHFELKPRDLSMVTDLGAMIEAEGAYTVSVGGGQPDTGAPVVTGTLSSKGNGGDTGVAKGARIGRARREPPQRETRML
jgi:beta-glucosidase